MMSENICNGERVGEERQERDCAVRLSEERKHLVPEEEILATARLAIEFTDLSYSICVKRGQKEKQILRCISGYLRPGRLTAIIGPSGAGKSTLLSILSGLHASNLEGSITVNGHERNGEVFRRKACFIPQEFALLPFITVKETLNIAACLKLGQPHTADSREHIVNEIANKLGLLSCLDTRAEYLSGGEKKRLCVGVELITNPPVMLLDEPTSGLDSAGSAQVIGLLHVLAKSGRTIACAVHQPGSRLITKFDDVIVLSQGRIFYCGPKEEILDTFASAGYVCPPFYNIAEFVLEVVTEQTTRGLDLLLKKSKEKYEANRLRLSTTTENGTAFPPVGFQSEDPSEDEEGEPQSGRYSVSRWRQFSILFRRAMICARRDHTLTILRLCAHVVVGLLLGTIFYKFGDDKSKVQSNTASMFFFLMFLFFANAMPAVQMFPVEAAVFLREHLNNWYSLQSYYIAKVLSDIFMQIICPSCFLAIAYCMTGQPLNVDSMWRTWLVSVLLTMLAQSFGIAAGAALDSKSGTFIIPAINIPMLLFAGFFLRFGEVPVYLRPLCDISYFRYAFEGVLQSIIGEGNPEMKECNTDLCFARKQVMRNLNMPSMAYYTIILVLVSWILVLHVFVYSILRWKLYRAMK